MRLPRAPDHGDQVQGEPEGVEGPVGAHTGAEGHRDHHQQHGRVGRRILPREDLRRLGDR